MDGGLILDAPWPDDLDPASVPFKTRSETALRRAGFYYNPERFTTLTEADVMGWWNAGAATVADIRFTGNRAIRRHLEEADERSAMNLALAAVAGEAWAPHIWHRDPRFARYVPKGSETVEQIALSGHPNDRRALWCQLDGLRAAVAAQAALSLPDAVAEYVEAISGQHGRRLEVLLARTGLSGHDPALGSQRRGTSSRRHSQWVAFVAMNPNSHRAVAIRRRALADQIAGLKAQIAAGDNRCHVAERLADTRMELTHLCDGSCPPNARQSSPSVSI